MLKPEMIYHILCISIEPFESKLDPVRTRKFPRLTRRRNRQWKLASNQEV